MGRGAAILLVLAQVLVGCSGSGASSLTAGGTPERSMSPSTSAPVTALPTNAPTEPPSLTPPPASEPPPEAALAPDGVAMVAVDGLRVRSEPSAESAQVGQNDRGTRVFILAGPVSDDGDPALAWWEVAPYACDGGCGYDPRIGWVTSGPERGWLVPVEPECPASFTPANTGIWHRGPELIACLGSEPITLEGIIDYWCCRPYTRVEIEPTWLAGGSAVEYPMLRLSAAPDSGGWGPHLRVDPGSGVELGPRGTIVRVTGHVDDPVAAECTAIVDADDIALNPYLAWSTAESVVEFECRTQFVVDSVEVLDFIPLPRARRQSGGASRRGRGCPGEEEELRVGRRRPSDWAVSAHA